jgi:hypothetical protein
VISIHSEGRHLRIRADHHQRLHDVFRNGTVLT